jgi:O-antigen/teichoic acid export membrane protein
LIKIFLLDFTLLVAQTTGLLLVVEFGALSAQTVCWVLAGAKSLFIALWFWCYRKETKVQLGGMARHLAQCVELGQWALVSKLLSTMPYYVFPWLLVILHGSHETAVYAAASTVTGVVNHALVGLTKGFPARVAEAFVHGGMVSLDCTLKQICRIVFPVIAGVVAVVFLAALPLSEIIFPDRAEHVAPVVRILSLAIMAAGLHIIIGKGLWATGRFRITFTGDLVRGILGVGLGAILGSYYGAKGCAAGFLIGNMAGSLVLLARYRALYSEYPLQNIRAFN